MTESESNLIVLDDARPKKRVWISNSLTLHVDTSIEIFIIDGHMEVWYGEDLCYEGPPFETLQFTEPEE